MKSLPKLATCKLLLAGGLLLILATPPALAERAPLGSGIDLQAMDRAVRPQDDFWEYVNGSWLKETEIPADKSRLSMFSVLDDKAREELKAIIEESAASQADPGSNRQKLGDMYNSFVDQATVEALGIKPLQSQLDAIARLSSLPEVAAELGRLDGQGVLGPLGFYVYPDARNPQTYGLWLVQSGLTMPDRDYYLKDEEKFVKLRGQLRTYAAELLQAAGYPDAEAAGPRILDLETRIAEAQMTRVESREAEKNYNKRSAAELKELLAGFPWESYAETAGLSKVDALIVRNLSYFEKLGAIFASTDLQTWKDYLAFRTVDAYAPALSSRFESLRFGFRQTALNGVPENEPRWKRAVDSTSEVLGEVLGQEYVARHFSPQAKARMEVLVSNLLKAYGESIKALAWMTDETKQKALEKLANFKPKIGYPDKWRDYSGLIIKRDDLVGNLVRSARFEKDFELSRVGQPVDPVDWGMTPQTVNAYYSPTRNEIVFPAAILQPPFFNMDADDAVNYGGIGAVIGHEVGHGFDDQGSKYDGTGNLRSWWTEQDRAAFDALGDKLVAQYDEFRPLEGASVNGRLTLGENIGDLAGVTIAYKAYLASLNGADPPVIDGFTGPQRFFMGWAQVWRGKIREDALRQRLLTDPHSPAQYRVIGPLRNVEAFYQAFGVQPGDPMFLDPSARVIIW
jgi:endothelin-converting enzyme/putative endopeptidase